MEQPTYPLPLYRWRVADPLRPGRRYLTSYHMSEADALARHPGATPEPGTLKVVAGPAVPHSTTPHGRIS